jgi:hypothetical protein
MRYDDDVSRICRTLEAKGIGGHTYDSTKLKVGAI